MKPLFSMLSGQGEQARLTTLIFHRVLKDPDPLVPDEIHARRFDDICRWLKSWFVVLPLTEAIGRLRDRSLPSRALGITFDDGYADNQEVAVPILRRHGLTATFFVSTGFLDGGRMWNDSLLEVVRRSPGPQLDLRSLPGGVDLGLVDLSSLAARRAAVPKLLLGLKYLPVPVRMQAVDEVVRRSGAALPDDLMMSSGQVRRLCEDGMSVGAHTVMHPILATSNDAEARAEILAGRQALETITGCAVTLFAYPNGKPGRDYGPRDVTLVREAGFKAAFSTSPGVCSPDSDLFQLPRYTPWRQSRLLFAAQLGANYARLWRPDPLVEGEVQSRVT